MLLGMMAAMGVREGLDWVSWLRDKPRRAHPPPPLPAAPPVLPAPAPHLPLPPRPLLGCGAPCWLQLAIGRRLLTPSSNGKPPWTAWATWATAPWPSQPRRCRGGLPAPPPPRRRTRPTTARPPSRCQPEDTRVAYVLGHVSRSRGITCVHAWHLGFRDVRILVT